MSGNRTIRLAVAGVALAAGLGAAVFLVAGGPAKLRPKEQPVRVAFTAPIADPERPAVSYYEAQVRDMTHQSEDIVSPLEFTAVSGPVDSHVVWLMLGFDYDYLVRVRAVSAEGARGLWSEWSDPYENKSPWQTPEPPTD